MSTPPLVPMFEALASQWTTAPDVLARIAARLGASADTVEATPPNDNDNANDTEPAASAMLREFAAALLGFEPHQEAARAALANSLRTAAAKAGRTVGQELAQLDDLTLCARYNGYVMAQQAGHDAEAMESAAADVARTILAGTDLPALDPIACANFRALFLTWLQV